MNITKKYKSQTDLSPQSKTFLIISTNYQIENLYNILKKNPSLVNTKDQKNETFLSYAIKRKNIEIAELILTSPILDYSYQDSNGNSYLHLAVINQLESIIRTLIQKGINVNLQNNDGNTALHFAYSTGDIKFITIVIESKADFTIKNKNGQIAEEIPPGTFPEIIDINNNNNTNNVNVTHNKNNTVTINLNVDNNNNNNNENDKDNNGIIINERGQINKSIRMNWNNSGVNNNTNTNNNISNNINNNISAINNNSIKSNISLNSNNVNNSINNNQFENTSKTKLKYSLVNFSYSDDGEGEKEVEDDIEENGLISQKNEPKEDATKKSIDDRKNKIKSSDIFDLTSSLSYQEKVANVSNINAHVVGEPIILSKKDSNETEDIVNINKVKTIEKKPIESSLENEEINNMINNGIEISQMTFQTAYQNGQNMNLSQVNVDNGIGKSVNFQHNNQDRRNGNNIVFDYSTSINREGIYENIDNINESQNKRESEGICNYDNNIMQSNTFRPQPEFNQDFAFSPMNSLKEPLNKKENGSEIKINNSKNINTNSINRNNNSNTNLNNTNNNSNNIINININNEINDENKTTPSKINDINFVDNYSTTLKRCNALNENPNNISNQNEENILSDNLLNRITKSAPTKSNNLHSINTNLSQASQNNINTKTNSKFDFNCPVTLSEEILNSSKNVKDPLYKFLSEIRMEKYYDIMKNNGFDDINLLINQTKSSGGGIKDKQLKEAGINIPGDRAKILIKLEEKAGLYLFPIPKEVYYMSLTNNYKNDRNLNKLNEWLKALKIENYLDNFIKSGYHSIELMLLQMESQNPITDDILKDEIGITKMGHRSRIINKLLEEAKSLKNKLKTSMLFVGNVLTEKICDCSIY